MHVQELPIAGLKLITCKKFDDGRGFFSERFRQDICREAGIPELFPQENFSRSAARVLRGLHYQYDRPQGKLVTCLSGRILDIAVDIRAGSKTFGQHAAVELDGSSPQWLWLPPGFAHGFCVLGDETADLLYKITEYYNPKGEEGILWDDQDLNVPWPLKKPLLSPKDQNGLTFAAYKKNPRF